ncbi:MAG: hypothetical protein WD058_06730 [Dehalococcoidia bacterium]
MEPSDWGEWIAFSVDHVVALFVAYAWPLTLIVTLFMFHKPITRVIDAVQERLRDRQQPVKLGMPGGPSLELGGQRIPEPGGPRPPAPPNDDTASTGSGFTTELDPVRVASEAALRQEMLVLFFSYLQEFLRPHTHAVLEWIAEERVTTEAELWANRSQVVREGAERRTVLAALARAGLIDSDSTGRIWITSLGLAYVDWRRARMSPPTAGVADPEPESLQKGDSGAVPPFTAYGSGLSPGERVAAYVRGHPQNAAAADAEGNWLMYLDANAQFGPIEGDQVVFVRENGQTAMEQWQAGGGPLDVRNGVQFESTFAGTVADVGLSLVVFNGGSLQELEAAARAVGAIAVMVTVNQEWVTFMLDAPSFVNATFTALFPNGPERGTPLIVVRPDRLT